jgi:hypothetical protein
MQPPPACPARLSRVRPVRQSLPAAPPRQRPSGLRNGQGASPCSLRCALAVAPLACLATAHRHRRSAAPSGQDSRPGRLWPTAVRPQGMRAECALTIRQPDGRLNLPTACTPAGCQEPFRPGQLAAGNPFHPGEPPQLQRRPSGPLHEFDQPLRQQPACEREHAGGRFVVLGVMARWCRSKTPDHHAGRGRGSGRPQTGLRPTRCPPAPADRRARPPATPAARFADLEASTAGAGTSPRRNLPAAPDRPWPGSGSPRTAAPTL